MTPLPTVADYNTRPPRSRYTNLKPIGDGSYGFVCSAEDSVSEELVCLPPHIGCTYTVQRSSIISHNTPGGPTTAVEFPVFIPWLKPMPQL